jgi:lipopolysaccharide biosynthesis protein WzzE
MQTEYRLDFGEMFKALGRKFVPLALCTAVGAGIGFASSYAKTPIWRATAQLDAPTLSELGNYYNLRSTYNFIAAHNTYQIVKDEKGVLSLAADKTSRAETAAIEESYTEFKRNLRSADVLHNFLLQSERIKLRAQAENLPIAEVASKMASRFSFQNASLSVPAERLNVQSENPEEAYHLLSEFIEFANKATRQTLNSDLITQWKVLFQQVKQAAELNLPNTPQSGANAPSWAGKLAIMKNVQPFDDKLQAYRFVKSPSSPTAPIAPKRQFWAMIGGLSGLLCGVFGFSFARLFRKEVKDEKN